MTFNFLGRIEHPRQLLQRVVVNLKVFAKRQHQVLESHWCYPLLEGTNLDDGCLLHFDDVLLNATTYDFYVRLRLENGQQLYEGFYPAERVLVDGSEVSFELPRPSWRDLQRVQDYFTRRNNHGIIESSGTVLQDAWDSTSAVIVAIEREHQHSAVVVAAGYSYPHVSMDFGGEEPKNMDVMTERFWFFIHVELNDYTNDNLYVLGFVADATSLNRLVLKG
jgi:hypothetical protein